MTVGRGRRAVRVCVAAILTVGALTSGPAASTFAGTARFVPGSAGVGDPYFPLLGNGGYDATNYALDLTYRPRTHLLAGTVTMTARATQNLSRFDLDLSGMTVRSVEVDGATAAWTRSVPELRITPSAGITSGSTFTTVVRYDGSPRTITGSPIVFGSAYGWRYTADGANVGDEPNAAHTWFPVNDHPSDKASYTFRITVPSTRQVVANGELTSRTAAGAWATYVWRETKPMASYLATVDIGRWNFRNGTTAAGIPEVMGVDPNIAAGVHSDGVFARTGAITDYWSRRFGPYPFTSTGAIVDNVPQMGFSIETQTRPLYGFSPFPTLIAHELAHEWFGDSVSLRRWSDIWLNEGFATFAEFLWDEHAGGPTAFVALRNTYRRLAATNSFWKISVADPQRNTMFSSAVYVRGAMVLEALRHRIGDATFFRLLQSWTAEHRYRWATTADFRRLATTISGLDLRHFFQVWLWDKTKPPTFTGD